MKPRSIRIVAVDDHTIFREGLCRLLATQADFQVVGQTASAAEAAELVTHLKPDVLLLDLSMPVMSGTEVLRQLDGTPSLTKVILLTASVDNVQMVEALRLGVKGLVLKEAATSVLFRCIRAVANGDFWLGHDQMSNVVDAFRQMSAPAEPTPVDTLTTRDLRIIAGVIEGSSNRDIATQLGLSEQTIKNHLSQIFDKVGVSNRLELALYVIHHRLLERKGL